MEYIDIQAKGSFSTLSKNLFVQEIYFISFIFVLVLFLLLFCIQFVYPISLVLFSDFRYKILCVEGLHLYYYRLIHKLKEICSKIKRSHHNGGTK